MLYSLLGLALVAASPSWQAAPASPQASPEAPPEAYRPAIAPMDPKIWTTPGTRLPDLELPRVDGSGLVRLKDYEGKKLLLIHFASW